MASLPKSAGPKSAPEKQLELLFVLKVQLDLIYKQLNYFEGTCKSVDRLNRKIRDNKLNPDQLFAEFEKFERNYRVLRKKLCKLDKILLTGNPYDKLYDLYESLVIGESIETGEHLIDTSAIDSPAVDEVDCSGSAEIEDTPVDNLAEIEDTPVDNLAEIEDTPVDDLSDYDDCNEIQFEPKQLETSNPTTFSVKTELHEELCDLYANVINEYSTAVDEVGSSRSVEFEDTPVDDLSGIEDIPMDDLSGIVDTPTDDLSGIENTPVDDLSDSDNCIEILYDSKQLETSNPATSIDSSSVLVAEVDEQSSASVNSQKFQCSQCDFTTDRFSFLKNHEMSVHLDDRPYRCPICAKSYKHSSNLSGHKGTHQREPRNKCNWEGCNYSCHYTSDLKAHKLSVHDGKALFQCSLCYRLFKHSSGLSRHGDCTIKRHKSKPISIT